MSYATHEPEQRYLSYSTWTRESSDVYGMSNWDGYVGVRQIPRPYILKMQFDTIGQASPDRNLAQDNHALWRPYINIRHLRLFTAQREISHSMRSP